MPALPTRSPVFSDKLSVTIDVQRRDRMDLIYLLEGAVSQDEITEVHRGSDLCDNYRRAYKLHFNDRHFMSIQIDPRCLRPGVSVFTSPLRRFMRLEWNPGKTAKATPNYQRRITTLLAPWMRGLAPDDLTEATHITRADITFDVWGVHVSALDIFGMPGKMSSTVWHGLPGSKTITGIHLGRPWGDRSLVIYDKSLEEQRRGAHHVWGTPPRSYIRRPVRWTRFELRLRDVGTLRQLQRQGNRFEAYTVRPIGTLRHLISPQQWSMYMEARAHLGTHGALSGVGDEGARRAIIRRIRQQPTPAWWDVSRLWAEALTTMDSALAWQQTPAPQ